MSTKTTPAIAAACALLLACARGSEPSQAEREARAAEANRIAAELAALPAEPLAAGAVRVRLAFGNGPDLDLYVTDPREETVYFANSPSRGGGRLERDVRCDDPAPRVETIEFAAALPGRYRIGVDFPPEPCGVELDEAAFVVVFESHGQRREQRRTLRRGEFAPIVLEADVR
jgi:hypothetical protein